MEEKIKQLQSDPETKNSKELRMKLHELPVCKKDFDEDEK